MLGNQARLLRDAFGHDVGHADLAWSVMHSLIHEPLEGRLAYGSNVLEISW